MSQTKVLAISGSPRRNGNSELLLDAFLQEFGRQVPDSRIEKIVLSPTINSTTSANGTGVGAVEGSQVAVEKAETLLGQKGIWDIAPCYGCDYCISGKCIHNDSMQEIYEKIKSAGVIVLSAPVYFYGLPSHVKAMIDRCQLFYNMKYRRKEAWRSTPGTGVLLSCGATEGDKLFSGISACVRYWFDAIDFGYAGKVLVRGVDKPGEITGHPEVFDETRSLARKVASAVGR